MGAPFWDRIPLGLDSAVRLRSGQFCLGVEESRHAKIRPFRPEGAFDLVPGPILTIQTV